MDLVVLTYYFLAALVLASATVVVFSKNIMYSAFALLFTLFGIAGLYVLLNADFMAVTQIMIYIGGILVLIIFGIMLTTKVTGVNIKSGTLGAIQKGIAGLLSLIFAISLLVVFNSTKWFLADFKPQDNTINLIGNELLTNYLLAFEAASVLLLIAIIGAALIARRK